MAEFAGRVVLVTGATGGLGPVVVRAFLDCGSTVLGAGRSLIDPNSGATNYSSLQADLLSSEGVGQVVADALGHSGRIDVLAHLLGGYIGGDPVSSTSEEDWDRMMGMNVRSAFLMIRAVLPHMARKGYGRILAVGSRAGTVPSPSSGAYAVSKAALHALIQTVSAEVRDAGITANAVLPSTIDTPGNRAAMPDAASNTWVAPESIANLLVWLASDAASEISGALVPIYGRA
jgi:NAD(P)-dependent dehydrogenase (short-subunit alcohol dehydrogenase family)